MENEAACTATAREVNPRRELAVSIFFLLQDKQMHLTPDEAADKAIAVADKFMAL